jgi:hypothetical protein
VNHSNTVIVDRRHFAEVFENRARNVEYRNRRVPNAITATVRSHFTSGGSIGAHRDRSGEPDLARGVVSPVAPRIAPVRESRLGGPTRANVRPPPRNIVDRQVVARRDAPATVARYVRTPRPHTEVERVPNARPARAHDRPDNRPYDRRQSASGVEQSRAAFDQNRVDRRVDRPDRPARVERPADESPAMRSPVRDPRAIAERVREDRERQVREYQQQRDMQQREVDSRQRSQRDDWQARREQQQDRDRGERQSNALRESAARQIERRQPESRQERREQPARVEQPRRMEQSQPQPRAERPPPQERPQSRPERQSPAEQRAQPREQRQQDGNRPSRH